MRINDHCQLWLTPVRSNVIQKVMISNFGGGGGCWWGGGGGFIKSDVTRAYTVGNQWTPFVTGCISALYFVKAGYSTFAMRRYARPVDTNDQCPVTNESRDHHLPWTPLAMQTIDHWTLTINRWPLNINHWPVHSCEKIEWILIYCLSTLSKDGPSAAFMVAIHVTSCIVIMYCSDYITL